MKDLMMPPKVVRKIHLKSIRDSLDTFTSVDTQGRGSVVLLAKRGQTRNNHTYRAEAN